MREIKFRFWDKALNKMLYRSLQPYDCEHKEIEVMQFTGFIDCKGKEIYEGDILKTRDMSFGYVVWIDGAFAIKSHGSEAIDWEHGSFYRESEVVGNIHENFEILEN